MKLLQLTSNNTNFKTLNFNSGLNIVLGQKSTINKKETFNGVGKSLSLKLIHYMLGGNINKCFKEKIINDEFILNFTHNQKNYEIIRNKKEIILNNKKYSETNYKEFLNNEFLSQNILNQNFTFRGLFSRFSRSSEDSYIEATSQITIKENGFINNKHNSFLLGLNIEFIKKKELLKKEQNNLKSIQKELKNFDINEKDNSELLDIEDEIKSLKKELKNFQIAENYNNLQMEADLYTKNINEKSNLLFRNRKQIENKEKNLIETPDIDVNIIKRLYSEVEFFFSDDLNKRLDDVEIFHKTLLENRKNRFKNEIKALKIENDILNQEIKKIDNKRAEILKILDNKGAFEEYNSLNNRLKELENRKVELNKFNNLSKEVKQKEIESKLKIDSLQKEVYEYYLTQEEHISNIQQDFRKITKSFYDKHLGTINIDVEDNINSNKIYKINPKITADGSKGINEVKIFSYDMLLYRLNPKLFGFIAHDSILFDGIDPEQIAEIFILILKEIENSDLQYFTTLNENIYKDFLLKIKDENIKEKIEKSVILQLSENNKLFGKDFDC